MSIQTSVLEDGRWVTRTLTADELRAKASSHRSMGRPPSTKPPTCGLLTRTLIDSPVVRWTRPVQLRAACYNDVALIGDNFVKICQLRDNKLLHEIIVKQDFGSRIRNAQVFGAPRYNQGGRDLDGDESDHADDSDAEMLSVNDSLSETHNHNGILPPQTLVLVLEIGQIVFLYLKRGPQGDWDFVSTSYPVGNNRLVSPGFLMAIDPYSRYLTLGCNEGIFIVYELRSMEDLQSRHLSGQPLRHIKSARPRAVSGIINKLEFLYPRAENDYHVILLIVTVTPEVTKLSTYDWEHGDDLKQVFAAGKSGHRLDSDYRVPQLIVPLTVHNAFLIIADNVTATCSDILQGPPRFEPVELEEPEDTKYYFGRGKPLWTAWTRPIRRPEFHAKQDVIYLAREDGVINFLEVGPSSEVDTSLHMGSITCNIDTAFSCMYHRFADVLIAGGDSVPGAVWAVEARERLDHVGTIPNWSPTVDIVAAAQAPPTVSKKSTANSKDDSQEALVYKRPDKIFACSGRGVLGSITQFRHGVEAKIGLDLEYSSLIRQCWVLPLPEDCSESGFCLLLALPDSSAILEVADELSEVSEASQDKVLYDLSSTTLSARNIRGRTIQVTTSNIVIVGDDIQRKYPLATSTGDSTTRAAYAAIHDDHIAVALHSGPSFGISVFEVIGAEVKLAQEFSVEGEITCVTFSKVGGDLIVIAGLWQGGDVVMHMYPALPRQSHFAHPVKLSVQKNTGEFAESTCQSAPPLTKIEPLTSIISITEAADWVLFAAGTRSGEILYMEMRVEESGAQFRTDFDKFGGLPVYVSLINIPGREKAMMVHDGVDLGMFSSPNDPDSFPSLIGGSGSKHMVWPTDANDPSMGCPRINWVSEVPFDMHGGQEARLVMIAGSRILISELQPKAGPVPRQFLVGGTPSKILFSERLNALITVVTKDGVPSLHFLDPETGVDISHPVEEHRTANAQGSKKWKATNYIQGLGLHHTRVMSLAKWSFKDKDKHHMWYWIVLSIMIEDGKGGKGALLVVSAENEESPLGEGGSRRIRFWTRMKKKTEEPVYSVATDDHGVFMCVGTTVQYLVVDTEDKRLRLDKQHDIQSPASWMEVVRGKLHVLTTKHSLEILGYRTDNPIDRSLMTQLYNDDVCRTGQHMIPISPFHETDASSSAQITFVSDFACGVYGLWPQNGRTLKPVFQADLQASVRRFIHAHTRPVWGQVRPIPGSECISSSPDQGDILAISIDGSLRQLNLLSESTWRLLKFIQNLAAANSRICPYPYKPDSREQQATTPEPQPKTTPISMMHVDGDVLQRCLELQSLEDLIMEPSHLDQFRDLVAAAKRPPPHNSTDSMDISTDITMDITTDAKTVFEDAYRILRYFLSPAI